MSIEEYETMMIQKEMTYKFELWSVEESIEESRFKDEILAHLDESDGLGCGEINCALCDTYTEIIGEQ